MTVEPGHAHAALLLHAATPGVHPKAHVYAELGPDLFDYLRAIDDANRRPDRPTAWELDARAGPAPARRCYREQPGNTVVVAGRNRAKLDLVAAAVADNLHVLVDPPWVLDPADLPRLARVLAEAESREVLVKELAPARHAPWNGLLRDLLRDPDVFGGAVVGTAADPGLALESTHYLPAAGGGGPAGRRPAWTFDPHHAGECVASAAPLVDLAFWLLFPQQAIDPASDIELLDAVSWPTPLSAPQFSAATGLAALPPALDAGGHLLYYGNGHATFTVRGAHVRVGTLWETEPPSGTPAGDAYECVARGSLAKVAVRHWGDGRVELTVAANEPTRVGVLRVALARRAAEWQSRYPGLRFEERGGGFRLAGSDELGEHPGAAFGRVLAEYVEQFTNPRSVPAWEHFNALAKYRLTTHAAELARAKRSC